MSRTFVVLGSYLLGGIPVAYLTGRLLGGIDIRQRGSGNVGASNIWQHVSRVAVAPVGVTEIGQGFAGPLWAKNAGHGESVQVLAGLAALAGHNWSPFLGFAGGRGVGAAIGFMLALSRPALAVFIAVALIGVALRKVPQFVGLGMLMAPIVAGASRQPATIVAGNAGMAGLLIAKRLLANDGSLPSGSGARDVLISRLVYDRDAPDRESWIRSAGPRQAKH
ncbi:MAG: glycerol-3-phosphate acyltransferase [Chloroflexi bacterium]|nr:glycerol-3-phosphate acyltransferase [Chloroflexota bacterium]